jgi:hypothetical protein
MHIFGRTVRCAASAQITVTSIAFGDVMRRNFSPFYGSSRSTIYALATGMGKEKKQFLETKMKCCVVIFPIKDEYD